MNQRFVPTAARFAGIALAACSATSTGTGGGTSADGGPGPEVLSRAQVDATLSGTGCGFPAGPWLATGAVTNGDVAGDKRVGVTCRVAAKADLFVMDLQLAHSDGSEVSLSGQLTRSGLQTNVHAAFGRDATRLLQNDCTLSYDTPNMGVEAGRVWGVVSCPKLTGAGTGCAMTATVKFEDCSQQ